MTEPRLAAKVVAVSLSPRHGFSKQPQLCIQLIAGEGIEGDAHRGRTTQHLYRMRRDPTQPNLCQVHLLAREFLDELSAKGHTVPPGEFGENILTTGLDLLAMPLGAILRIGPEAVIEVTGLRTPCSQIDDYQPGLQQHCWGPRDSANKRPRRAGIMAIILTGGTVQPGDPITVELPTEPWKPLPAV